MIDLHLHTTASDGRLTPEALVDALAGKGITTFAVTDHDTLAAFPAARAAAEAAGLRCVPGIEITAVHQQRDVHVLGYFFDSAHPELTAFLEKQRSDRRRRLTAMAERLTALGVPVDLDGLIDGDSDAVGRALGRPVLAAALVKAGHVKTMHEAFERYLSAGRPAFMRRVGLEPEAVIALIGRAGGVSSLAHPAKLKHDELIQPLAAAGLTAIEVFHPDHDPIDERRYAAIARQFDLFVTGGSDYHGPGAGRVDGLGRVSLPAEEFDRLAAKAGWDEARA